MTRPRVRLVDTSTRDGNQSLWGAAGLTTGMVEALGPDLEAAGFVALDFTSSTHLSVGVRWHKEDPWERIARMRAVVPTTRLSVITTGMRFMSWDRSPVSLMRMSMRALVDAGVRRLQIAEPMNDTAAASAVARMAKDEGMEEVVGALTFTVSPVHDDSLYAACAKALAHDESVDVVYLKDPGGLLTPERIQHLVPEIQAALGTTPFELHSHCTTGLAPEVYVLAAQLGVEVLHTAIGALANGTSQPSAIRLVENLDAVGIDVDVDVDAVRRAERTIDVIAASQGLEPGRPTELDLSYQRHQVPGGMMGTLRRQLNEIGQIALLPRVLDEVGRVRAELGYPIMVTPYSQYVGSQAVLNVLAEQAGQQRWSRMPDEILRYLLGHFGTPPGPVDPLVRERAAANPRTRELDVPLPEPSAEEVRAKVYAAVGGRVPDHEVVLRSVLPTAQVEAMHAAGRAPRWSPERARGGPAGPVRTAREFVDAVTALPNWRSIDVELGDERVRLRRGADQEGSSA
ncbi:MAG TPA: biotin carboxyl carrier protein [Actinomycetes bacterium]|nr:biotin carboxyl carrier protein [Actinomycetes bacterium]